MNIQKNFTPIEQMAGQIGQAAKKNQDAQVILQKPANSLSFEKVLHDTREVKERAMDGLKFSKHASSRLLNRQIDLSENQLKRLENGTKKAREKGINESLVMVDNLAFIVNVKNNTVITAVNEADNGVFTNIDGAVIG